VKGLGDVFILKLWEFRLAFCAIRVESGNFDDTPHGQTEVPQTGLAIHAGRIADYSIKCDHKRRVFDRFCDFNAQIPTCLGDLNSKIQTLNFKEEGEVKEVLCSLL
jgi:hypothetical protein